MKRKQGLSRVEVVVLIVTAAVLAAVLFPAFVSTQPRPPQGVVRGGDGQPLGRATLRFRDAAGRVVAVVQADENGRFERHGLRALSQNAVDGFLLARYLHSTGGAGTYVFSPRGTQQIVFRDGRGRPVPGVAVSLRPDARTWYTPATYNAFDRVSDENGIVTFADAPVSARWDVYSRDRRYAVQDVGAAESRNCNGPVRTPVTLVAPAVITGRLVSPRGAPLGGYKVFAARQEPGAARQNGQRYYLANSGRNGRFRLSGLLPGVYQVSATTWRDSRAKAPARRVHVQSGQVVCVNDLRLGKT